MQITRVSAHYLRLPEVSDRCDGTQDTCLIKIETDAGLTGWGEVDSAPTIVKAVIEAPLSHQISNGLANVLLGKTVDISEDTITIVATGTTEKMSALESLLSKFDLKEMVRTGKVVMARGSEPT